MITMSPARSSGQSAAICRRSQPAVRGSLSRASMKPRRACAQPLARVMASHPALALWLRTNAA